MVTLSVADGENYAWGLDAASKKMCLKIEELLCIPVCVEAVL